MLLAQAFLRPKLTATPHTLCPTFATRALQHGADQATLRRLLGHEHPEKPGRYLHPSAEKLQQAVEGL